MPTTRDDNAAEPVSGEPLKTIIKIENVSKVYRLGEQDVTALKNVNLEVREGNFMAIAGSSGSGKSTLLNIMGCIDTPSKGRVVIDGKDVSGQTPDELANIRARTVGFIFQTFNLLPVLSAEENVEYPLLQMPEIGRDERRERVNYYMKMVGLGKYASHRPNQLSGGQRQRVAIARALVTHSRVLLADEPTANLDRRTGESILELMQQINQENRTTFVFSTHDKRVMSRADQLVRMEDGQITKLGLKQNGAGRFVQDRSKGEDGPEI